MSPDPGSQTGTTLLVLLRDPTDPQAWKAFVQRYTPKILGWCRQWGLQNTDAEDVTQEVLCKLAQQIRRFPYDRTRGRFRGWLKTVARHAWCDLQESRRRAGWGSGDPRIQRLLESQAEADRLVEALDQEFLLELYAEAKARVQLRVSRTTWRAFQLLVTAEWSGSRVAAELGMNVAAVYVAKNRVQKMLAEEIRKLEGASQAEGEESP
jgi:RNA polymerase sigma-70 factor (ECF subfamily)